MNYTTQWPKSSYYSAQEPEDWIKNPIGIEKRPADPTWERNRSGLDAQGYVGPSGAYRAMPRLGACGACGMGADEAPTGGSLLVPLAIAAVAVGIFWATLKGGK